MHVDLSLKDLAKPLTQHPGHNPVSIDEFKIRRHFRHIKQRISNELELWPSTIFDQEIKKLEIEQQVSKLAIANYFKPYSHSKSGFKSRRAKNKTKNPKILEDFIFENPLFQHLKKNFDPIPLMFLQYEEKKTV